MGMEFGGVLGILILVADIWAIVSVVSSGASTGSKVVWILLIVVLPLIGFLIWVVAGPRGARTLA